MSINGLNGIFGRVLDGLRVSQRGMNVVANNIANTNTPGYARQFLVQGSGAFGGASGLNGGIASLIDPFLERQIVNEYSDLGFLNSRSSTLSHLETIMDETNHEGLGSAMNQFFNSISELSQDPSSGILRQNVRERAIALSDQFKGLNSKLQNVRKNLSASIKSKVPGLNDTLTEIARLNQSIINTQDQSTKNEIKSQQYVLLQRLSNEMGITYFETQNQTVNVQLSTGGLTIVEGMTASSFSVSDDLTPGGELNLRVTNPLSGQMTDVTSNVRSGELGGLLKDRNDTLNTTMSQLNDLAFNFVTEFNALHSTGYGLDGNTGRNFFVPIAGPSGAAAQMAINPAILNDLNTMAAADANPIINLGNNGMAMQLAGLRDALTMEGGSQTFTDFYSTLSNGIGMLKNQASNQLLSKSGVVTRLQIQRENISGVDLNEEAADLIRYQKAFEASARVMSAASQMMDVVLRI
jgi:flagellar hook-associated protein 1 FlgK